MSLPASEVVQLFEQHVHPLSNKLVEMLNEHYSHQTERRGCGYTQATRFLADFINRPRDAEEFTDLKIFEGYEVKNLKRVLEQQNSYHLELKDWRHLDQYEAAIALANETHEFATRLQQELTLQKHLRAISAQAHLEESKLICDLLEDIILPKPATENGVSLTSLAEKPKVGSCPMAENFFLKIAHGHLLRQGEINIFTDHQGQPVLLEKLNMGDDHSCISLRPVLMNGVRVPAGALFSVDYDRDEILNKKKNKTFKGYIMPYDAINGFWFLRLTTLAVSPEHRKRAFTTHFDQQVANGLYSPGTTKLEQLYQVALSQIE